MPEVRYSSNNSGGSWWLDTEDWKKLEQAGWVVEWHDEPWLGALAYAATREGLSLPAAIKEWEAVTGKWAEEEGCNCCGQPHNFWVEDGPEFDFIETDAWEVKGELNV